MNSDDIKAASLLPALGGAAMTMPFFPVSTLSRLNDGEGVRGGLTGGLTDLSRGLGGVAGGAFMGMARANTGNAYMRLLALLAGITAGGAAGHTLGKETGEAAFRPGNSIDRFQRAVAGYDI